MLGVGFVERFNPAVVALKRKLADGAAGRIVQMHARRLSPFPNRDGMAGVALDLATHDIDVMRFLSGSEVERVYAESARAHARRETIYCPPRCGSNRAPPACSRSIGSRRPRSAS